MDVGEAQAYADVFAHAVATANADVIASYLSPPRAADIKEVLDKIPRPITKAENLVMGPVAPAQSLGQGTEEFVSITEFSGSMGKVLLSSRWATDGIRLAITVAQLV